MKNALIAVGIVLAINAKTFALNPVPQPIKKPVPITKRISQSELTCLAKNIYYEAGNESYDGKLAVATVTMNRVRHPRFPKTICGVVYQRTTKGCQFSWTCVSKRPMNNSLYQRAKRVATEVLTKNVRVVSLKNALYFHNTSIKPNWTFARPIKQIGNHIFYAANTYGKKERNGS